MENPFLNEPKKDIKTVFSYNRTRQLEIFNGQCFNNASLIVSSWVTSHHELHHKKIAEIIFDLANILYNEGLKRNYLEAKENERI